MPNQKPNAITLNLCPDCGVPPRFYIYSDDGSAECDCFYVGCESYNVKHAESWQEALAQWNENTAKAYAERSESPISDNCEHEPTDVENRPQDGLECDTREKVLADLERLARKWHDYDGNFMRIYNHVAYAQVKELLDRQAAISERELCAKCEWPSLAAMPDIEQQKRIAEQDRRIVEYAEQVDSLTAERDDLRSRLVIQANSFQKLERDNAKLRDTLARVRELVGDAE